MATSALWASIDPAAEWRVSPEGYSDGGADPSRQVQPANVAPWSPNHPLFGFAVLLAATGALVYYVFEAGGVGAEAGGHVGSLGAEADLELGKGKGK